MPRSNMIGLESIGKHLVGQEKWESVYPDWRNDSSSPPLNQPNTGESEQLLDHVSDQDEENSVHAPSEPDTNHVGNLLPHFSN